MHAYLRAARGSHLQLQCTQTLVPPHARPPHPSYPILSLSPLLPLNHGAVRFTNVAVPRRPGWYAALIQFDVNCENPGWNKTGDYASWANAVTIFQVVRGRPVHRLAL